MQSEREERREWYLVNVMQEVEWWAKGIGV